MTKNWFKKFLPIFLIVAVGLLGVTSFFHSGFFPSHDGEWMVIRFSDFHRSLADGQWPVRWAGRLNFSFGYPVFDFLYPGTFYFTEIFHFLKLNFVDSIKAAFAISFVLSGIFMYLFVKEWFGKLGGLAAAVLYLYTPYRFVDLYVRGSLGESVAFMFPPLIFWSITKIYYYYPNRPDATSGQLQNPAKIDSGQVRMMRLWMGIGALGIAGLITTHNVIAYLFLPIILLFIFFLHFFGLSQKSVKFLINSLLLIVLGFGASAFFWLPALWDKQYTIFDKVVVADFAKNFPSVKELIFPSWGFGPSEPGNPVSLSFQIGVVNLLILVTTAAIMMLVIKNRHSGERSDTRI